MQRRVRSIILLPLAGLFTLLAASAQSGNFIISQHGHPVGTANFNFASSPRGYESTSLVRISMKDLDYSLSKTEQLSAANQLVQVQLSAIVNGSAVTVSGGPEAAQLQLKISANGHNSINRLAFRPAAVFLPDFDPGALDTLLALGAAHKMRDLWAVIPKKTGSIAPILLAAKADERGTLDGKPRPYFLQAALDLRIGLGREAFAIFGLFGG